MELTGDEPGAAPGKQATLTELAGCTRTCTGHGHGAGSPPCLHLAGYKTAPQAQSRVLQLHKAP